MPVRLRLSWSIKTFKLRRLTIVDLASSHINIGRNAATHVQ